MEIKTFSKEDSVYTIYCNNIDTKEGVEVTINNIMAALADYMLTADEYDYFEQEFNIDGEVIDSYEECIWEKLVAQKDSYEIIEKYLTYVEHIMKIRSSEIWEDDECPLAEKAALYASLADKKFIPFYTKFLQIWDMEHEVYQEEDLEAIVEKHGWCSEIEDLIISRSSCNGQADSDCLCNYEDLISENYDDLMNSDFFVRLITAVYEQQDDYDDWKSSLDFFFPDSMKEIADKKMLEILEKQKNEDIKPEYKITFGGYGSEYIMLSKKINGEDNKFMCYWTIELEADADDFVLTEVYNDRLYTVTKKAKIAVYDVLKKELVSEIDLSSRRGASAKISMTRNALVVAYTSEEYYSDHIKILSLDDLSKISSFSFDKKTFCGISMDFGINEQILFYYSDFVDGEYIHGYSIFNEESGCFTKQEMSYPPRYKTKEKPYINVDKGFALLPSWNKLELNCDEDGRKTVPLSVRLFDLVNFKEISVIKIIDYPILDIFYDVDKKESTEKQILETKVGEKEYDEIVSDCYGVIYSVIFHSDTSFFVGLRSGLMVEVGYDKECSNVLMPSTVSFFQDLDFYPLFQSELLSIDDKGAIVQEYHRFFRVDFDRYDLYAGDPIVRRPFVSFNNNDNIIIPSEDEDMIDNIGKYIIEVEDINKEACLIEALDNLSMHCSDLQEEVKSWIFVFKVKDNAGNYLDETAFFRKLVSIDSIENKIIECFQAFISYRSSQYIRFDCETPALALGMLELVKYSEEYLPLFLDFFENTDMEHDVFIGESIVPVIEEKYPSSYEAEEIERIYAEYN